MLSLLLILLSSRVVEFERWWKSKGSGDEEGWKLQRKRKRREEEVGGCVLRSVELLTTGDASQRVASPLRRVDQVGRRGER
jgi:hypothetical protein